MTTGRGVRVTAASPSIERPPNSDSSTASRWASGRLRIVSRTASPGDMGRARSGRDGDRQPPDVAQSRSSSLSGEPASAANTDDDQLVGQLDVAHDPHGEHPRARLDLVEHARDGLRARGPRRSAGDRRRAVVAATAPSTVAWQASSSRSSGLVRCEQPRGRAAGRSGDDTQPVMAGRAQHCRVRSSQSITDESTNVAAVRSTMTRSQRRQTV